MASTNDLNGLVLPGPYKQDSQLGYQTLNSLVDDVGTIANVIQQELASDGTAATSKFARGEATFINNGAGVYEVVRQTALGLFQDSAIAVTGRIDFTYLLTLPTTGYGIHVTPWFSASIGSQFCVILPDYPTLSTTTCRLWVREWYWNGSTVATQAVDADGFEISIHYDD